MLTLLINVPLCATPTLQMVDLEMVDLEMVDLEMVDLEGPVPEIDSNGP